VIEPKAEQSASQAPPELSPESGSERDLGIDRLRRLRRFTDAGLSRLSFDDLFTELLGRLREALDVDTATVLLVNPAGRDLVTTASIGLDEEVREAIPVPVGEGFNGRIAATGQPAVLDRIDHTTVVSHVQVDRRLASMAGVPILAGGRLVGVLNVGSLTPRRYSSDDLELLQLVADRASPAAQSRLSQPDRETTLALQRSLLPARPPAVAGFDVAARYIPGDEVGVGGDWYDLFTLPSGHIGVAIGDVAGNGLRAAVVMGRIRSALRAYALETIDPADVLTRLNRKICLFEPDAMATAAYAVIDPGHTTATVSLAGHPPPAMIQADGTAKFLEVEPDLPLGVVLPLERRAGTITLPPGSAMLYYTDGLVERRERPIHTGMDQLLAALYPGTAEQLCTRATSLLAGHAASDDVAILAIRRAT
jgi:serine phosphatase RsbU (regulator of sigma subunit)